MADDRPSSHQPKVGTRRAPVEPVGWAEKISGRQRPKIDLRLRGLAVATGRPTNRFRCSSETRSAEVFAARVKMIRELGQQLYEPHVVALMVAVLDGQLTITELHIAHRRGEVALQVLLKHVRSKRAPKLAPLIDRYIKEKRQRKPEQMRRTLHRFCEEAGGGLDRATTAALTREVISEFLVNLTRRHPGFGEIGSAVSKGTTNRYRSAVGGFCSWLVRTGRLPAHPIAHGQIPAHSERDAERMPHFAPSEYSVYLEEFGRDATGLADPELRMTALLLLHTGADVGEVLSRAVGDVRWGAGEALTRMRYRRSKTHTPERLVPVPSAVAAEMRALVALYDLAPGDGLLEGVTRGRVRGAHRRALAKIKRTDIRVKDLRHIAAQFWREGGADLEQVRDWLGHATLDQVRKYAAFGTKDHFDSPPIERAAQLFTAAEGIPRIAAAPAAPAAEHTTEVAAGSEPIARRA